MQASLIIHFMQTIENHELEIKVLNCMLKIIN